MRRRRFLGAAALGIAGAALAASGGQHSPGGGVIESDRLTKERTDGERLRLFLCGDVMTGRGIDQILPHPSLPEIHEAYLTSAEQYIEVGERASGPIPRGVDYAYVWGEALSRLEAAAPDLRIVNLETAVTTSDDYWPGKGIHYRMHPANLPVLAAAGIDCCALANNHVLDWGHRGLQETLEALHENGIRTAGAGADLDAAAAPAVLGYGAGRRLLVFSVGHTSSGIDEAWQAGPGRQGVWWLDELSPAGIDAVARRVHAARRPGDIVLVSLHWGGNWGYGIARRTRDFAHDLLDHAEVDLVHGHSSHHPLGIEVYRDKLILYGCGDFINDYEGIRGNEHYRDDLRIMYLPDLDPSTGRLLALEMAVFQSHRFRLRTASAGDVSWLAGELNRESLKLGSAAVATNDRGLSLRWD
jgi:poly-gamma-glutamate capsule biosynthesis protein CapA/YwtB (metallophosphatase superfamily)